MRKTAFVLAALVAFFLGSMLLPHLNDERRRRHLVWAKLGESAPPELVLATTALGGFRGLLLNAVAYRAWELKVDGKFWELVQLYEWISQLQPHASKVWTDLSWNMSYNIVAEIKIPEDRWRWVWRSIEYLRDRGLKYNPRSEEIAREISWIFQQKIGRETDEFHIKYMWYLSGMIEEAWGNGRPDLEAIVAQVKATKQDNASRVLDPEVLNIVGIVYNWDADAVRVDKRAWDPDVAWDALVDSDEDVAGLVNAFNSAGINLRDQYKVMRALLDEAPERGTYRLRHESEKDLLEDPEILQWVMHSMRRKASGPREKLAELRAILVAMDRASNTLEKRFLDVDSIGPRRKIELYLVERNIRMDFKMDPERMLKLEQQYAPMEWRLPESHAMYWALVALELRLDPVSGKPEDTIDARRLVFFCTQQLYRRGTILFRSRSQVGRMLFGFNLAFISAAEKEFTYIVDYYRARPTERAAENIGDPEKQFLEEAVRVMSWAGQEREAKRLYKKLQTRYPSDDRKNQDIDSWVTGQVRKMVQEWGRQTQVQTLCSAMLLRGYAHLIVGQMDLATAYHEQCRQMWGWYREDEILRQTDKREESVPTFDELKSIVVEGILRGDYGDMFSPDARAFLRDLLGMEEEKGKKDEHGETGAYKRPHSWLRYGIRADSDRMIVAPKASKIGKKKE